jgi:hypothetical protein
MNVSALQPWQTAISAIVGFTGVIYAMLYNARSARKLARDVRRQEAVSLCVALQQELIAYRDHVTSVLGNVRLLPARDGIWIGFRPIVSKQAFDANIGKVGLLKPEQVAAVLTAYHLQGELLRRVKNLGEARNDEGQDEITVHGGNFQPLIAVLELHATAADNAIKSLGPSISWTSSLKSEPGIGFMNAEAAASLGLIADPDTGKLGSKKPPSEPNDAAS